MARPTHLPAALPAVYSKAGVNSRGTLVAHLFFEHLLDSFHGAFRED